MLEASARHARARITIFPLFFFLYGSPVTVIANHKSGNFIIEIMKIFNSIHVHFTVRMI